MELKEFFAEHPKIALAFSGGVDSAYLLYAAKQCGAEVKAYYVQSAFQPQFELDDAERLAAELGAEMTVLSPDILACREIAENPPERCYLCKQRIFHEILHAAAGDGYETVMDGTNASDDAGDRPGMRALRELGILSPLRLCGLTKEEIRRRSAEAGLFTWNKPAYACLATRIPTGRPITHRDLQRIEMAEDTLREMGFRDFRVRLLGDAARIQLAAEEMELLFLKRREIRGELGMYFSEVLLDLEARNEI